MVGIEARTEADGLAAARASRHGLCVAGARGSELRAEARVVRVVDAGSTANPGEGSVDDDHGAEVATGPDTFVIGARRQDAG